MLNLLKETGLTVVALGLLMLIVWPIGLVANAFIPKEIQWYILGAYVFFTLLNAIERSNRRA